MSHDGPVPDLIERRQSPRYPATALPSLKASILAGPDVELVDVSRHGLLLESQVRLTPGVGVCLNVTLDDQLYLVSGRITRVDAALIGGRIKYRAGVALDQEWAIFEPPRLPADAAAPPEPLPIATHFQEPIQSESERRYEADLTALRQELELYRRRHAEQQDALDQASSALSSAESFRHELLAAHAAEQAAWYEERQRLEDRLRAAEYRAAEAERNADLARENERRLAREQERERARLEGTLREREQRLAELEAGHAALLSSVTHRADSFERARQEWESQQHEVAAQLEKTETWCADQQDLLYRIRMEMSRLFSLLDGQHAALPPASERAALTGASAVSVPLGRTLPGSAREDDAEARDGDEPAAAPFAIVGVTVDPLLEPTQDR